MNMMNRLGILFLLEWLTRRRKKGRRCELCYEKGYRHKADRNATEGQHCYNYQRVRSDYDKPINNETKEAFYNQLATLLSGIPRTVKLLLIADFNARIGGDNDMWHLFMGKRGIGKRNSNGELLLALCSEFELLVTNTMFKQ